MLPRRGGFEGDGRFSLSSTLSFLNDLEDTGADWFIAGMVLGDGAPMLVAYSGGLVVFSMWIEGLGWP